MMAATKPADLTLAIQKATEGFTVIVDRPMDNDLIVSYMKDTDRKSVVHEAT